MKVEYLTCDLCDKRIDMEKDDRAVGKLEIASLRLLSGTKAGWQPSPSTPFRTDKVADMSPGEVLEKTIVDLCGSCSKKVEDFCITARTIVAEHENS